MTQCITCHYLSILMKCDCNCKDECGCRCHREDELAEQEYNAQEVEAAYEEYQMEQAKAQEAAYLDTLRIPDTDQLR